MNTHAYKSASLLPKITFLVVILFGIAGVARIMGWLPNSLFYLGNNFPVEVLSEAAAEPVAIELSHAPSSIGRKARCPECGVIVSMREIDAISPNGGPGAMSQPLASHETGLRAGSAKSYEFSVRLSGGARRVFIGANSTSWRVGERVIVIDGTNASQP